MHPKNQHTVPKFMLKGFTTGKKKHIFVLDKYTDKEFKSNIIKVATEHAFYDFEFNSIILSLEESLSEIESKSAKIIERVRKSKSIKSLNESDLEMLAYFVALQYMRVNQRRNESMEINKVLALKLSSMGVKLNEIDNFKIMTEEENKFLSLKMLQENTELIAQHIAEKYLILEESCQKYPLYISDNPVVKYNSIKNDFFSTLGFSSDGVEIMMPISNTLCLHYICPILIQNMIVNIDDVLKFHRDNKDESSLQKSLMIYRGILGKETCKLDRQNVNFLNSLQVSNSSRWIYSSDGNFSIAKDIIKKDGSARLGPTVEVN